MTTTGRPAHGGEPITPAYADPRAPGPAPFPGASIRGQALDASTPNAARIYDVWSGGKDNFGVDRRVADEVAQAAPFVIEGARANRAFLRRAVTHLTRTGIDQFLDQQNLVKVP